MSDSDRSRVALAERLLDEVVYASRARQGAETKLAGGAASCGLGAKAAFEEDFGPRAREAYAELWPDAAAGPDIDAVRRVLAAWVKRQDGFDRERNHFLKAFRHSHGFDRTLYSPEQRAAYDAGLDDVNAKNREARREAAMRLLDVGSRLA